MASYLIYNRIAKATGKKISHIEKDLGLGNATIANAIKRKATVDEAMIDKLSKAYPELDLVQMQIDLLHELSGKKGEAPTSLSIAAPEANEPAPGYGVNAQAELIDALKQAVAAQREATLAEREAKEAYKELSVVRKEQASLIADLPATFLRIEARLDTQHVWLSENLSGVLKKGRDKIFDEIDNLSKKQAQAYMKGMLTEVHS